MEQVRRLSLAGILIGVGMGGFFDGILFHQILQIHNMLSNRLTPDTIVNMHINMFWDGIFHAFTWIVTAAGIVILWQYARTSGVRVGAAYFVGSLLLGWGLFNLIEGVVDHQILQVHHVVQRSTGFARLGWDAAFLAWGVAMSVVGLKMRRHSS